jgi:hypothetical protein
VNSSQPIRAVLVGTWLVASITSSTLAAPSGTAFSYQGVLTRLDGSPAEGTFEFRCTVHDAVTGGQILAGPLTNAPVVVDHHGLFHMDLDFIPAVWKGVKTTYVHYYLGLGLRPFGSPEDFIELLPRQPLRPVPYTFHAISSGGLTDPLAAEMLQGTYSGPLTFNNASNQFAGDGSGLFSLNASRLNTGTVPDGRLSGNVALLTGSPTFAGTVSANADLLAVGDVRGRRLNIGAGHTLSGALATIAGGSKNVNHGQYSVIAGGEGNLIQSNVVEATISGGTSNTIQTGALETVIGGGLYNRIESYAGNATIGGGYSNLVHAGAAMGTIAGGNANRIEPGSHDDTIGGGSGNVIHSNTLASTISGGGLNHILPNANFSAIPGGANNVVGGSSSLAAGQNAQALHKGTFVWADSTPGPFASTANDQFLIRANSGVGIGAPPAAGFALDVAGNLRANAFTGSGGGLTGIDASAITSGTLADARIAAGIARDAEVLGLVLASDGAGSGLDADLLDGQHAAAFALAGHNHNANYWNVRGDNIVAGDFLGTLNNLTLELRANNATALRLEPNAVSPNVIGGFGGNVVGAGVAGATIGGGGQAVALNSVTRDFGTIGGGSQNTVIGTYSTIGGGTTNIIVAGPGSADPVAKYSTIAGGWGNAMHDWSSTIGGGGWNTNFPGAYQATIAGGYGNSIQSRY